MVMVGGVDVLVGTHRLLGKDVSTKNLGMLVVDEEHRFGVKHKEYIRSLKKRVDVLTPVSYTHLTLPTNREV